jgi:hypothetical protein
MFRNAQQLSEFDAYMCTHVANTVLDALLLDTTDAD